MNIIFEPVVELRDLLLELFNKNWKLLLLLVIVFVLAVHFLTSI